MGGFELSSIEQNINLFYPILLTATLFYSKGMLNQSYFLTSPPRPSCSISNQRSGLQMSASRPYTDRFRCATHALIPTVLFAGRFRPAMVAPTSGMTRARGKPTAGCSRKPSFITACRYGNSWASLNNMGSEAFPATAASSISLRSRWSVAGFFSR